MQVVPLNAIPNQTLSVLLENQSCQINVYQLFYGLFMDLYLDGELIVGGVLCQNENRIVRNTYFGFVGDFVFVDSQGNTDPNYEGFGPTGRYSLVYLELVDLVAAGL